MKSASRTCGTRTATAGRGRALSRRGRGDLRNPQTVARRHPGDPEVDRQPQVVAVPGRLVEAPRGEAAGAAELAGERLREGEAVRGAEEGSHHLGDEGAVEGVTRVGGRDEVSVAGEGGRARDATDSGVTLAISGSRTTTALACRRSAAAKTLRRAAALPGTPW